MSRIGRRTVKIGGYAMAGTTEYVAIYINQVDLNLTRNQHSISYADPTTPRRTYATT